MIKIESLAKSGMFLKMLMEQGVVTLLGNMFHSDRADYQPDMNDAESVNKREIIFQLNQIAKGNLMPLHEKVGCLSCSLPAHYVDGQLATPNSILEGGSKDQPRMLYTVVCPAILEIIRLRNLGEISPRLSVDVIKNGAKCLEERVTTLH